MKQTRPVVLFFIGVMTLAMFLNGAHAVEADPVAALKACARMENAEKRVACYEALGKRVLGEEVAAGASETAAPVAEAPVPAAAAVPAVAVAASPAVESPSSDKDDKYKPIHAHVRACQKASDNRYFFIMDDGEIWKQSGGRTHRFKECSFDVTIRKDGFGYKMTIDGEDKSVRVRRHK